MSSVARPGSSENPNPPANPCPESGCPLGLVQIDGLHESPICPAHGSPDDFDWCPRCDAVRRYDGEVCTSCGRVWGDGA